MQVISYGPSKMGHDTETDETYFTTELLVDGVNSGIFINRALYPIMKRFIKDIKDPKVKFAYVQTTIGNMVKEARVAVDVETLAEFIANEIKNSK